jgi:predicted nucleotidyltransferase component of viral defense system
MAESKKDYHKLYKLQNKLLNYVGKTGMPFYLGGGTALGRFYLNHRYSEDLDFFTSNNPDFQQQAKFLSRTISEYFSVYVEESLFDEDSSRIFVQSKTETLRVIFTNLTPEKTGKLRKVKNFWVDNPENILTNKLTAVAGRDEPKDVFDILHISLNYSFNWQNVFDKVKLKTGLNKMDLEQRLRVFHAEQFNRIATPDKIKITKLEKHLIRLTEDLLYGKDNSLGAAKTSLSKARPVKATRTKK